MEKDLTFTEIVTSYLAMLAFGCIVIWVVYAY